MFWRFTAFHVEHYSCNYLKYSIETGLFCVVYRPGMIVKWYDYYVLYIEQQHSTNEAVAKNSILHWHNEKTTTQQYSIQYNNSSSKILSIITHSNAHLDDILKMDLSLAFKENFFVLHLILMKLGEILVHMGNYNFTKFHQNQMKNNFFLLIAHFLFRISKCQ